MLVNIAKQPDISTHVCNALHGDAFEFATVQLLYSILQVGSSLELDKSARISLDVSAEVAHLPIIAIAITITTSFRIDHIQLTRIPSEILEILSNCEPRVSRETLHLICFLTCQLVSGARPLRSMRKTVRRGRGTFRSWGPPKSSFLRGPRAN